MINPDLTDAEIAAGGVRLYYPPEDRMLMVSPHEILNSRGFAAVFELTHSEFVLIKKKAQRLVAALADVSRMADG